MNTKPPIIRLKDRSKEELLNLMLRQPELNYSVWDELELVDLIHLSSMFKTLEIDMAAKLGLRRDHNLPQFPQTYNFYWNYDCLAKALKFAEEDLQSRYCLFEDFHLGKNGGHNTMYGLKSSIRSGEAMTNELTSWVWIHEDDFDCITNDQGQCLMDPGTCSSCEWKQKQVQRQFKAWCNTHKTQPETFKNIRICVKTYLEWRNTWELSVSELLFSYRNHITLLPNDREHEQDWTCLFNTKFGLM